MSALTEFTFTQIYTNNKQNSKSKRYGMTQMLWNSIIKPGCGQEVPEKGLTPKVKTVDLKATREGALWVLGKMF